MIQYHYCPKCLERKVGKPLDSITNRDFKLLLPSLIIRVHTTYTGPLICPVCDHEELVKLFGMLDTYVRGYGFSDRIGMIRDMDLHTMVNDKDPYKEHRLPGEKNEVIRKLQKSKDRNTRPIKVHLG